MTWREKNNLKRITQWIIAVFVLGYLFAAVVKRQGKIVKQQEADFVRILEASKQYDLTMNQIIEGAKNHGK